MSPTHLARVRSNVAGVTWPPISLGVAGSVATVLRQLERTQWMPAEELAAAQRGQLRLLARQLATTAPHFRARLTAAGLEPDDLGTPEGLAALPPMTRRDLQDAGDDLFATEVPPGHAPLRLAKSSGSTGEPVAVRRTAVTDLMWWAMTLRDHLWRDLDLTGRLSVCRFQAKEHVRHADWGVPFSFLFHTGPAESIPALEPDERFVDRVVQFDPQLVQAYPSMLDALVLHVRSRGVRLRGLRAVHATSETLSESTRAALSETLAVPVWDSYSCEEVGYVALECPAGGTYHVTAETVFVEILDDTGRPCAPGELGRVVVTDLHNTATPLIRYDLGDLAEPGGPCVCGRGLPTMRRVLGRVRNLVRLPDGTRHWPVLGIHTIRDLAPIDQFQIRQRRIDALDVSTVGDTPLTDAHRAAITELVQAAMGHPFAIRISWSRDPLPRGPGGKFEEFWCEL